MKSTIDGILTNFYDSEGILTILVGMFMIAFFVGVFLK